MSTFKYDAEKVVLDKYTICESERTWEVYNWLQYFSLDAICQELDAAEFRIERTYADVAGSPLTDDSDQMAVIARKH